MSAIAFEILFILFLILANGIFAMSEMALVSARKARLQQRANADDAKARVALVSSRQIPTLPQITYNTILRVSVERRV